MRPAAHRVFGGRRSPSSWERVAAVCVRWRGACSLFVGGAYRIAEHSPAHGQCRGGL
jgi:hypothetical protein